MPVKLNNGGHFQEYDPMTGEYISGSENDDSNELQLKSHVIEAKRNIDKAKKDSNIQVPFPKEYSYDKEYAQQYIELLIQRNGKLNIDTSSVRFLAFDNRKLFFSAIVRFKRELMCLYDNGEFEKVSITQGDINKNVVLYNRNSIIEQTERIVEEMKQKNLKFSEESILFATKDKNGNILWLEKGNDSGGLNHIIYGSRINKTIGHKNDYLSLHGVTPDEIPYDIYRMVSSGTIIHEKKIIKKGKPGIERVYYKDGRFYLCCGIGTNGYIVSAYPIDEERYKEIKRRSIK